MASEISSQSRGSVAVKPYSPGSGANFFDQFDSQPETQGPPQRQVGMGEAIGRGIQQGATFNFGDEIAGLKAASGIPNAVMTAASVLPGVNMIAPTVGAARMGYEALTGGNAATDAYNQAAEADRAANKLAQEQRPYSTMAGNVAGAMALPVGGVMNAATLPARMGMGAAVGAGVGALSGAGEGEGIADRASRATVGGALGGVIGGASPPLVEGAIQAGRATVGPVVTAIRGAMNPETEAARRVASAVSRDVAGDPHAASRLSAQEMGQSYATGGPATLMDMGGETTRALARSAANTSPEGRASINQVINDRFEGQVGRVTDWLRESFHYPNADSLQQAIKSAAKSTNGANYERVMAANPVVSVPQEITSRPVVAQAMKDAVSLAKNYGEKLENVPLTKTILSGDGFHIADDVVEPAKTSLRYWDYVKKALDARIDGMKRNGGIDDLNSKQKADFGGLVDAKNALVAHLDQTAKGYAQARKTASEFFGASDALEAGQNYVTQNFKTGETVRALANMSPVERKLFQDGFVSRYIETLEKIGDRRSVLNTIAASPSAREKLNVALGPAKANELETKLRVEGIMDLARGAVQGNSTTARQLAELGFAGGATGLTGVYGVYNQDPQAMTIAAVSAALLAGRRGIDNRVAAHVAKMLISDDPRILRQGLQAVAKSKYLLDNLRVADRKIASVGSSETPKGLIPIQAAVSGRAEDNPDVNGPRR
jgi:hypothetical protein